MNRASDSMSALDIGLFTHAMSFTRTAKYLEPKYLTYPLFEEDHHYHLLYAKRAVIVCIVLQTDNVYLRSFESTTSCVTIVITDWTCKHFAPSYATCSWIQTKCPVPGKRDRCRQVRKERRKKEKEEKSRKRENIRKNLVRKEEYYACAESYPAKRLKLIKCLILLFNLKSRCQIFISVHNQICHEIGAYVDGKS